MIRRSFGAGPEYKLVFISKKVPAASLWKQDQKLEVSTQNPDNYLGVLYPVMSPQLSQDDINKILEVRGVFQKSNITKPDARHCSWHAANLAQ